MTEQDEPADADLPPWEQHTAVRRDCDQHRGELLLLLSYAAGLMSVLSLFFFPAAITLPFAFTVLFLAGRDLAAMESGTMNPEGANQTRDAAQICPRSDLGGLHVPGVLPPLDSLGVRRLPPLAPNGKTGVCCEK